MFHSHNVLTINLSKICDNYRIISKIANKSVIGAAVKANAYGLGIREISKSLIIEGCSNFFVASIDEALELKEILATIAKNYNIFVLNGVFDGDAQKFVEHSITPVLNNLRQVELWKNYALKFNKRLPAILHVDTGINRLAMSVNEIDELNRKTELLNGINLLYVMSHLASSENIGHEYNKVQLDNFTKIAKNFPNTNLSFANSSGIFLGKDYHFNMVRSGAALYGINPTPTRANPMQNIITLNSSIIHLQTLPANTHVGYNMSYTTKRNSIIATIPIGYADGYPRLLSNKGAMYIDGEKAQIVGKVSMDLTLIDVTDIRSDKIFIGQKVEVIGEHYGIANIAQDTHTIEYEILTNLSKGRYKKHWISSAKN